MPRFNRERRVIELLRGGRAVLLIRSWDTPGVLAAGRAFADAIEHPPRTQWDPIPVSVESLEARIVATQLHGE
jgi:hypothetical protein